MKASDFFCSVFSKNLLLSFFILYLSNSLSKDFSTTSLFNKHILKDMPNGTKLYFENQDINLIMEEFKFLTFIFFEIFLSLNFFSVFCSLGQTTPVISLVPNGAFTKSPAFKDVGARFLASVMERSLEELGLKNFINTYPDSLSGGMKRRVSIARAFVNDPNILLMDEPFVSFVKPLANELRDQTISLIKKNKVTVILVTHDMGQTVGAELM